MEKTGSKKGIAVRARVLGLQVGTARVRKVGVLFEKSGLSKGVVCFVMHWGGGVVNRGGKEGLSQKLTVGIQAIRGRPNFHFSFNFLEESSAAL